MPHFNSKKQKGQLAEWVALIFFWVKGYRLVRWNYQGTHAQVDLIICQAEKAQKGQNSPENQQILVLVEVKFRLNSRFPLRSISPQQLGRLHKQAAQFRQRFQGDSHPSPAGGRGLKLRRSWQVSQVQVDALILTPTWPFFHHIPALPPPKPPRRGAHNLW